MKHHILRAVLLRILKVAAIVRQKRLARVAAVHPAHVFHGVQLLHARIELSLPEIKPVGQAVHVQPYHALARNDAACIVLKAHQLHAVKAVHQPQQRLLIFKPVEVAGTRCEIELRFHAVTSAAQEILRASVRIISPSASPSVQT